MNIFCVLISLLKAINLQRNIWFWTCFFLFTKSKVRTSCLNYCWLVHSRLHKYSMSFENLYFYQRSIRIVRFHNSAEFTIFKRISVILLLWRLPSPFDVSSPNDPRHHPSCQPHHEYFTYFMQFFYRQYFQRYIHLIMYVVFSVGKKRKSANSLLH